MIDVVEEPPAMSRSLLNKLIEYREVNSEGKCSTCGKLIPEVCPECGQPLQITYKKFCKNDICELIPTYRFHYIDDFEETIHPILVCPICGLIDWWRDEKAIDDEVEYFKSVYNYHKNSKLVSNRFGRRVM